MRNETTHGCARIERDDELSLSVVMLGFVGIAVFDFVAGRREEVPPWFARLRPVQMVIPVLALGAIALKP